MYELIHARGLVFLHVFIKTHLKPIISFWCYKKIYENAFNISITIIIMKS